MRLRTSRELAHISDEEMLLTLDAELSSGRLAEVRKHLFVCDSCRQRMHAITTVSGELQEAYRQNFDSRLPNAADARAAFREKLARAGSGKQWLAAFGASLQRAQAVIVLAAAVFGFAGLYTHLRPIRSDNAIQQVQAAPLPKQTLTPGAVSEVPTNICLIDPKDDASLIPTSEAEQIFREYGVDYKRADDYELDYLITPALGGTTDIRNLWPEPHSNTEWNSYVKDQLEERLHQMVCSGQIDLRTAQRDIATNWIAAYRHYFHSDTPLPHSPDPGPNRSSLRNG